MSKIINIYCDESCHLEDDDSNVMVLGGIICPNSEKDDIFRDIRTIKQKHCLLDNTTKKYEIKWTKISKNKLNFFTEIINYFFDNEYLRFRGLIVPNKSILCHDKYDQTHDKFYYKMYYELLNVITKPFNEYNIYLDIKDTRGYQKTQELQKCLPSSVKKIQEVRSHEVELIQLADLFIGALMYYCKEEINSLPKSQIINFINKKVRNINGKEMSETTSYSANKFNVLKIKLNGDNLYE